MAHRSPGCGAGAQATKPLAPFRGGGCPTLPIDTKGEVRKEGQEWGDSGPVEEVKVPRVLPPLTGLPAVDQHGPLFGMEVLRVVHLLPSAYHPCSQSLEPQAVIQ